MAADAAQIAKLQDSLAHAEELCRAAEDRSEHIEAEQRFMAEIGELRMALQAAKESEMVAAEQVVPMSGIRVTAIRDGSVNQRVVVAYFNSD